MILNNAGAGNAMFFFMKVCLLFWVNAIFMKVRKSSRLHFLAMFYLNIRK
jgi:hypothetical protein